jgi:tRNA-splicing ligase RtcB
MQVFEGVKVPIKAWTNGVPFEEAAFKQVMNLSTMPFIHKHIAVMPDVHHGKGATVGSVIATKGAIIPAAVGVDIGCGMMAARLRLKGSDLPDSLATMRAAIEAAVPHGRTDNGGDNDRGAWGDVPEGVQVTFNDRMLKEYRAILDKHPQVNHKGVVKQFGTLGTGNHFIEVCLDENDDVWVMLHSGSRGVGNRIGTYFIEKARKDMERWFINLPDKDLAYIPEGSDLFDDYWQALAWAQLYARTQREIMMGQTMLAITKTLGYGVGIKDLDGATSVVNCHHNYVNRERHFGANVLVTRKGAVRAQEGDWGIIPGSMGTRSYIVMGKGNRESFNSCSHGAGRKMSRTAAEKQYTLEDHIRATEGVECRKDQGVLDETPMAYKDIDAVLEAERDLVDVKFTLKQVLCVKG